MNSRTKYLSDIPIAKDGVWSPLRHWGCCDGLHNCFGTPRSFLPSGKSISDLKIMQVSCEKIEKEFIIQVSLADISPPVSWKVKRSEEASIKFLDAIKGESTIGSYDEFLSAEVLLSSLNRLITATNGRFWSNPVLANFLDDKFGDQSHLAKMHISTLEIKVDDLTSRLQSVEQLSAALLDSLNTLLRNNQQNGRGASNIMTINAQNRSSNADSSDDEADSKNSECMDSSIGTGTIATSQHPSRVRPLLDMKQLTGRSFPDMANSARTISGNSTGREYYEKMSETESAAFLVSLSPSSSTNNYGWNIASSNDMGLRQGDAGGDGANIDAASVSSCKDEDVSLLTANRVKNTNVEDNLQLPLVMDSDTEVIVRMMSPHEPQVHFRQSVIVMIQHQIRLVLGAVSFDSSMTKSHCFLPTDPISITVILCQGQIAYWHTAVADRLRAIIEHGPDVEFTPGHNTNNFTVLTVQENIDDTHRAAMNLLSTVALVHEMGGFKVTCKVGDIDIEIAVNNRSALCGVAFLDEFNAVLGRDNLFKRSVVLIRSWWLHEASAYVNTPISHFLSYEAVLFMIVAVFNLHWKEIRSPAYALYYFLRMYQDYDGKTQAITIQGIVNFISDNNPQPNVLKPEPNHLIDIDWLGKFWQLFNVHDPLNGEIPGNVGSQLPSVSKVRLHMLYNSMSKAIQRFDRFGFSVVHPFTHTNLVTEKLSSRRTALLNQVFKVAYSNLQSLLNAIEKGVSLPGSSSEDETLSLQDTKVELIGTFYSNIVKHYDTLWRPDVFDNQLPLIDWKDESVSSVTATMQSRQESISEYIHYCSFVADSVISESAVLTFCIDLLTWRGPLPTGEVGKLLSEATVIPSLSHKLREKFGGLKKFLEKNAAYFVFSNDHPFNPHVLLRQALSAENLELIDRGIFPVHLISKTARQLPAKKTSSAVSSILPGPTIIGKSGMGDNIPITVHGSPSLTHMLPGNSNTNGVNINVAVSASTGFSGTRPMGVTHAGKSGMYNNGTINGYAGVTQQSYAAYPGQTQTVPVTAGSGSHAAYGYAGVSSGREVYANERQHMYGVSTSAAYGKNTNAPHSRVPSGAYYAGASNARFALEREREHHNSFFRHNNGGDDPYSYRNSAGQSVDAASYHDAFDMYAAQPQSLRANEGIYDSQRRPVAASSLGSRAHGSSHSGFEDFDMGSASFGNQHLSAADSLSHHSQQHHAGHAAGAIGSSRPTAYPRHADQSAPSNGDLFSSSFDPTAATGFSSEFFSGNVSSNNHFSSGYL